MSFQTFVCCNAKVGKGTCETRQLTTNKQGTAITLPAGWVEVQADRKPTEMDAAPMLTSLRDMVRELDVGTEQMQQAYQRMVTLAVERMPMIQTVGHLCPLHAGMLAGAVELVDNGTNAPIIDIDD